MLYWVVCCCCRCSRHRRRHCCCCWFSVALSLSFAACVPARTHTVRCIATYLCKYIYMWYIYKTWMITHVAHSHPCSVWDTLCVSFYFQCASIRVGFFLLVYDIAEQHWNHTNERATERSKGGEWESEKMREEEWRQKEEKMNTHTLTDWLTVYLCV